MNIVSNLIFHCNHCDAKAIFRKNGVFEPPLGDLGATYDDHLRLVGKHVCRRLPISVNWTCSLGRTAEALRAIIGSKSAISLQLRPVGPKVQVQGVAPHQTNCFSHKTRVNDLSHGIKIWTDFSLVLSQSTRLTDGRTNRWTDRNLIARPRLPSMQRGKN